VSSSHQLPRADAEPEPTEPDHHQLYQEIGIVRTRGFGNLVEVASDLPGLRSVARVIGSGTDDAGKIEDAIRQAVQRLGSKGTSAIEALLGMTPTTRGEKVEPRRERAAKLYDHKSYELFRTRFEPSLLMFVATYLRVLTDERHLAKREHIVARAEQLMDCLLNGTPENAKTDQPINDIWSIPVFTPVYHLRFTRCGNPAAWAYSIHRAPVDVQAEEESSHSKLKQMLHGSSPRYQLNGRWGTLIYRPPNLFVRSYRALVTKRW
jgi:hypothetical protein